MRRHVGKHHADWRPLKERDSAQWAQHDCDMNPHNHGRLHRLRGSASTTQYGRALKLAREQDARSFIRGKGLRRERIGYALYVQGRVRGYLTDIVAALAWAKAAQRHGLMAECVEV